jgi:iron complex transport system ATP-binding protein
VAISSRSGQIVGLIGPNGAGKSTLLRVLAGLIRPSKGEVLLDGDALEELALQARARKLAYMPQERIVNWPISVFDLVAMGRLPYQHPFSSLDAASRDAVAKALGAMSIHHLTERPAMELSGGELARVLLARALAQTPQILLADEPTAGLDPAHKLRLLQHLKRISESGMSVILVLHDLTMAARFCDHLVLLDRGRVYAEGSADCVLSTDSLRDVYHIEAHIGTAGDGPVITPLNVRGDPS